MEDKNVESIWSELNSKKTPYTRIAETCAEYTIPSVFTEKSFKAGDKFEFKIVNGYMAKLINNLVGKLALSILPSNQPFFRLEPSDEALEIVSGGDISKKNEIIKLLSKQEREALKQINKSGFRNILFKALRIAIITGDCLIERIDNATYREHTLKNYCIKRDSFGNISTLILKEKINKKSLPNDIKIKDDTKEEFDLYTLVEKQQDGSYLMSQYINNEKVSKDIILKRITDRFISIRWNKNSDEDYGRSYVEEHITTIKALNQGLDVVNKTGIVSSKAIFCVNPAGITDINDFIDAKNGDVIVGSASDISIVTLDKTKDLSIISSEIQSYKRELAEAFLVGSSVIRDAERVTAREIELVAKELEVSFGGIYTELAEDIQKPLVQNALDELNFNAENDIDIVITSGVEALGRTTELNKINQLIQELQAVGSLVGSEKILEYVNISALISEIVANIGIAGNNLIYSEMEQQAIRKQMQQEQLAKQLVMQSGSSIAGQAGDILVNQHQQQGE